MMPPSSPPKEDSPSQTLKSWKGSWRAPRGDRRGGGRGGPRRRLRPRPRARSPGGASGSSPWRAACLRGGGRRARCRARRRCRRPRNLQWPEGDGGDVQVGNHESLRRVWSGNGPRPGSALPPGGEQIMGEVRLPQGWWKSRRAAGRPRRDSWGGVPHAASREVMSTHAGGARREEEAVTGSRCGAGRFFGPGNGRAAISRPVTDGITLTTREWFPVSYVVNVVHWNARGGPWCPERRMARAMSGGAVLVAL